MTASELKNGPFLPRPFKGDRYVDTRDWEVKPSDSLLEVVGDLSDPVNITYERAFYVGTVAVGRKIMNVNTCPSHQLRVDERYIADVFGFLLDNLSQMNSLSSEQRGTLDIICKGLAA